VTEVPEVPQLDSVGSGPEASLEGLLDAVVDIAAGLELPRTLRRIIAIATRLVDARYGALGVLALDGTISDFIVEGMDSELVDSIGQLPTGGGILGLLIDQPHPIRLTNLRDHPNSVGFPAGHPPMTSFVGVPIRVRAEVFGNLYLTDKRSGAGFTEQDERLLVVVAAAAGVAIENARLYSEVERRARWLRASSEVAMTALKGGSSGEVLSRVVQEARRAAGADLVLVAKADVAGSLVVEHVASEGDASHWVGSTIPRPGENVGSDFGGPSLLVPISAGDHESGVLVMVNAAGAARFPDEERGLAVDFGSQAALAVELAVGRVEHERLALLEDRDRIGRDLHDLVIQRLFATGMMLQGAQRLGSKPEVTERIGRAVEELDQTILEVRSTIFALHENRDGEAGGLRSHGSIRWSNRQHRPRFGRRACDCSTSRGVVQRCEACPCQSGSGLAVR
jgi:two-component system sensor histidine kinase DevS